MGMLLLKPKVEANLLFYIKNEIQDQRVTVNTTSDIQRKIFKVRRVFWSKEFRKTRALEAIAPETYFGCYQTFMMELCVNSWRLLTMTWRRPLSYRNQSNDLRAKSMDWFLYDNGLRHKRVNRCIGLENKDKKIVMILVFFKAV